MISTSQLQSLIAYYRDARMYEDNAELLVSALQELASRREDLAADLGISVEELINE